MRRSVCVASLLVLVYALLVPALGTALAAGVTPTAAASPGRVRTPATSPTASPSQLSPAAWAARASAAQLHPTATPSRTATPTQTATPTKSPPLSKFAGLKAVKIDGDVEGTVLDVPLRSQYDLSPYQNANCGPASLAMVLQAYGLDVPTERIRALANQLQGTYGYDEGIALDYLATISKQAGLRQEGLYGPDGHYRQWAIGDIVREVQAGYPVITLVHYTSLPAHQHEASRSDHYVVVVGVTDKGFVINDPASVGNAGYRQLLTPDELTAAWKAASVPEQAVAFLPPTGKLALQPVSGEANDGPGAAVRSPTPRADNPSPTVTPRPSPTVATATPLPTNTPEPTVDPALLARADTLKDWTRPTEIPAVRLAAPTPTARPTAATEATPSHPPGSSLALLVVLAVLSVGSLGVIKSTSR